MVSNRDRNLQPLEITRAPWPLPPLNLCVLDATRGVVNLQWDDPAVLAVNQRFRLLGVNIYRSFDSEFGPFHRLTDLPVGTTFWRDETDNELVVDEDVSTSFTLFGNATTELDGPRYVFKTLHYPIVSPGSQKTPTNDPEDVHVYIDGVRANVLRVNGPTGEVEIDPYLRPEVGKQKFLLPNLPTQSSRVTCSYRYTKSLVKTDLRQRIFYRVTAVGIPDCCSWGEATNEDLVETPIEHGAATSTFEMEKLDWIWRSAIRNNRFILEQGGERVRVFLRKNVGIPCPCFSQTHKQPQSDCPICFGTSIVGGYEGPYDIILAPDDSEMRIAQKDIGRTIEHAYEVWTGPQPVLSQRDFILKLNGDRYSVGPVRQVRLRATPLQQHFMIGAFDEKDIRYRVPVGNPVKFSAVQFAPRGPEFGGDNSVTEKSNIGDEREYRGRTPVWKNTTY